MATRCGSCEVLYINGVRCHETGCPEAWRDALHECDECGADFCPEERGQRFCSDECAAWYYGFTPDSQEEEGGA